MKAPNTSPPSFASRSGVSSGHFGIARRAPAVTVLLVLIFFLFPQISSAQTNQVPDYSRGPSWFPHVLSPYRQMKTPAPELSNPRTLSDLIRDGKIELSLTQLAALVIENNLNLAVDRSNNYFAQADLLRTKAGSAARGVLAVGADVPDELFAGALGSGIGSASTVFANVGSVGAITGSARTVTLQPRDAFDPTFQADISWDRTVSPLNTVVVAGSPVVTTNTAFYDFDYQQAFSSGTSLSIDLANQRQSSTQQSLIYNPDVITRVSFAAVQQLTTGFGRTVNRRFQTVARNNVQMVKQWFLQQVDSILAQAEESYWDLVSAQQQIKATQQALEAAQQLYENNKMQAEVGVLAPLDVVSAQAQLAATQRNLIVAQTNLQQQELSLKNFFSRQISEELGDARIVATDALPEPQDSDVPPLDEAISMAVRNRPEVPQAEASLRNSQLAVKVSRQFLKPTFNIFGLFDSAGLSGNQLIPIPGSLVPVRGGLGRELNQFIRAKYPEYAVGFALTIPIKNRSALADNARAGLLERQSEISVQNTEKEVGVEARTARINLLQAKAVVAAANAAVEFSAQSLDAEQKKNAAGVSTSYNVILAQRNLLEAQLSSAQAHAGYAKALVEMQRSTGTLLEKSHGDPDSALQGRMPGVRN